MSEQPDEQPTAGRSGDIEIICALGCLMKAARLVLAAVIALLMASIVWYRWDSGTNHGYTCGYWGQFNTVSNSLSKLPGITILKAGCNADVTLEEFGFEVLTPEGQQRHVWFSETDPLR